MTTDFSLSKTYEPASFEKEIYERWLASKAFHAVPDGREPYVIMMPLPNVTGALHMGHAMDNCMQDLLIRWHRMLGHNTLWMPGTDHAGIATQAVVEKRLKELEGKTRHDVGREGLVQRIWDWKQVCQTRIIAQQQRMGCSCDWDRYRFTMDKVCARAVRHTFFRLFDDGLVARGKRLVNWDPYLRTSISDDEVYHETVQGHFWHLLYPVIDPQPGEPTHVTVATTRPETMLGDTAVAVHPDPEAYLRAALAEARAALAMAPADDEKPRAEAEARVTALEARIADRLPTLIQLRDMARAGRKVRLPLAERPIPLVCDEWAKPDLGSGCVKITPAHDPNDYEVWKRHRAELGLVNILQPDGTLNEHAGAYQGLDRFVARDAVVHDLQARGLLPLIEDREIEVGHSDRSKTPIEPYLSDQWFVRMGDQEGGVEMGRGTPKVHRSAGLVQAAIDAVHDGRVRFHPERFVKTYLDWLGEKRDWPISRQLWWGHRIPVWSVESTVGNVQRLLDKADFKDLLRVHAPSLRVRVAIPDEDRSLRINGSVLLGLPADPTLRAFVDVCLLTDDPALVGPLEALGFVQDPDVLDTWFSSAIWPHSTLGWPDPATADPEGGAPLAAPGQRDALDMYYPGSCLVTARDIITLWVARMVLTGLYNCGDVPFHDVFIHANILDGKGERMSKSKGNGIDPVDIIEEYGTDAMRYVLADMQTGNQDIRLPVTAVCPSCGGHVDLAQAKHGHSIFTYMCGACGAEFDVLGTMPGVPAAKLISERFNDGRKFCNKLWNTARFALGWLEQVPAGPVPLEQLALEDRWILSELNAAIRAVTAGLEAYNPSLALGAARDFMWGALCDWYLELLKPRLAEGSGDTGVVARRVLAYVLDQTLRLLHPFVPYVTEHLFQRLAAQVPDRSLAGLAPLAPTELLLASAWPKPVPAFDDPGLCAAFRDLQAATSGVREVRATQQVPAARRLTVTLKPPAERAADLAGRGHVIARLAGAEDVRVDPDATLPRGAAQVVVGDLRVFVHDVIDADKERERLGKELARLQKEVKACEARLGNEGFVARAPQAVVDEMRTRQCGYREQLEAVEAALAAL